MQIEIVKLELTRLEESLLIPAGDIVVNVRLRHAHTASLHIPRAEGRTGIRFSSGLKTPQLVQFITNALDRKASEDSEDSQCEANLKIEALNAGAPFFLHAALTFLFPGFDVHQAILSART